MQKALTLWIAAASAVLCIVSCSMTDITPNPTKPHHTATGFRNNYPHDAKQSFWQWRWEKIRDGLPQKPAGGYHFDTVASNVGLLSNPALPGWGTQPCWCAWVG